MKIKQVFENLRNDVLVNSYYLKGDDQFLQEFFPKHVTDYTFGKQPVEKVFIISGEIDKKNPIDEILTSDLFSSRKVFILKNFQRLNSKQQDEILEYVRKPLENHLLFIINDDFYKKTKNLNKLEKLIGYVNVQTPLNYEMKKWVKYFFKKNGMKVENKVVDILVDLIGDSLSNLKNEIDKICLYKGNEKKVFFHEMDLFSFLVSNRKRKELLFSIAERNFNKSILSMRVLLAQGDSMLSLLYPITILLQELLFAKMNNGTYSNYKGYINLPLSLKNKILSFKEFYTIDEIEKGLIELGKIDYKQKTENSNDEIDLLQFLGVLIGTK